MNSNKIHPLNFLLVLVKETQLQVTHSEQAEKEYLYLVLYTQTTSLSEFAILKQATLTFLVAEQASIVGKRAFHWVPHCTPGRFGLFRGNLCVILPPLYPCELDLELNSTTPHR